MMLQLQGSHPEVAASSGLFQALSVGTHPAQQLPTYHTRTAAAAAAWAGCAVEPYEWQTVGEGVIATCVATWTRGPCGRLLLHGNALGV